MFVETDDRDGQAKSVRMVRVGGRLEQAGPEYVIVRLALSGAMRETAPSSGAWAGVRTEYHECNSFH